LNNIDARTKKESKYSTIRVVKNGNIGFPPLEKSVNNFKVNTGKI